MQMFITIWGSSGKITGVITLSLQTGGKTTMNDSQKDNIKMDNATLAMFDNKLASEIVSAIYIIVTLANLSGNGISLFLLLMRTSPKTPSIIFMINLTITDLIVGTVLPFQIAYQMQGYNWTLGAGMCNVLTWFSSLTCTAPFYSWLLLVPTATWGLWNQCASEKWGRGKHMQLLPVYSYGC